MRLHSAHKILTFCALSMFATSAAYAGAPNFPERPVTIVVPYLPGGTPDIMARLLGPELNKLWGQPVVVENKAGANGQIGSASVANAKPDGYTMVLGTTATHVVNGLLYSSTPYDGVKDFTPVAMLGTLSNVLVVNPQVPAHSVKELVALLKANPDKYNYGSGGNGSSNHLAAEMFKTMAGVSATHVPYKSAAPAMIGLLSGETAMIFENVSTAIPHIKSGALRPLGVTSAKGSAVLPDVPPIGQAGVPGYDMSFWYGLLAPAGTDSELVKKINADIHKVLEKPEVRAKLEERGVDISKSSPSEFAEYMSAEVPKWTDLVEASGAKID